MRPPLSSLLALWIAILGVSMLIFGDFFIAALPQWTGYFPIPGIMLAHIRGVALLAFSLLLWHKETVHAGSFLLLLFCIASFTPSVLGLALAIVTIPPAWKCYRLSTFFLKTLSLR